MFFKKKNYRELENNKLLIAIERIQDKLQNLNTINENAIDVSDDFLMDLKIQEKKYRYLYLQARKHQISAKK